MSNIETLTIDSIKQHHESESEQSEDWNDALSDVYSPTHSNSFNKDEKYNLVLSSLDIYKENDIPNNTDNEVDDSLIEDDQRNTNISEIQSGQIKDSLETTTSDPPWKKEIVLKSPIRSPITRIPVEAFQLARVKLKPVVNSNLQVSQSTPDIRQYMSNDDAMDKCIKELKSTYKQETPLKKVTFKISKPKQVPEMNEDCQPEWVRIARERSTKEINWTDLGAVSEETEATTGAHCRNENTLEGRQTTKLKSISMDELKIKAGTINKCVLPCAGLKSNSFHISPIKSGVNLLNQQSRAKPVHLNDPMISAPPFESVLDQLKSLSKEGMGFHLRKTGMRIDQNNCKNDVEKANNIVLHDETPCSHVKETISHTQFIISTGSVSSADELSLTLPCNDTMTDYASPSNARKIVEDLTDGHMFVACKSTYTIPPYKCSQSYIDAPEKLNNIGDNIVKNDQNFDSAFGTNTAFDEEKLTEVSTKQSKINIGQLSTQKRNSNTQIKESAVELQALAFGTRLLPSHKKFSSDSNLVQGENQISYKRRFSPAFYKMTSSCTDLLSNIRFTKPDSFTLANCTKQIFPNNQMY